MDFNQFVDEVKGLSLIHISDHPAERGEPYLWNDCSADIKCGAEPV